MGGNCNQFSVAQWRKLWDSNPTINQGQWFELWQKGKQKNVSRICRQGVAVEVLGEWIMYT